MEAVKSPPGQVLDPVPSHELLPSKSIFGQVPQPQVIVPHERFHKANGELDRIVFKSSTPLDTEPSIPDNTNSMSMVLYASLTLDKGDTLVYVDVPAASEDNSKRATCLGLLPASQHFWVNSENLFALADSNFPRMLNNAIYQARVKRRRNPPAELLKGVKYLLDLTPPAEGDDLVFQISELSLTPGIIKWWQAAKMRHAEPQLVSGHDDVCCCNNEIPENEIPENNDCGGLVPSPIEYIKIPGDTPGNPISVALPPTAKTLMLLKEKGQDAVLTTPPHFQIPDYCVIRHCNSIIRFMLMVEGKDVKLDSAARVWSMVAISKIFEAPSVVRDQVATWIMSNPVFIEVLPEEALRIGYRLELPDVTQSAFRILVNELALEEAAGELQARKPRRRVTVFGRRLGAPDDETANVIQHAARAFIDRLKNEYEQSIAASLFDRVDLGEWNKMKDLERLLERQNQGPFTHLLYRLRSLMAQIQSAVTNSMKTAVERSCEDSHLQAQLDNERAAYTEPRDFEPLRLILEKFNTTQRVLCPFLSMTIRDDLEYLRSDPYFKQEADVLAQDLLAAINRAQQLKDCSQTDSPSWESFLLPLSFSGKPVYIMKQQLLSINKLQRNLESQLPIARAWDTRGKGFPIELSATRHMLLTLTGNEMKYLPLWAGGNDDGTGGVFEAFLPPAEMGPNGPGPAYHTGQTLPSDASSISDSFMDGVTAMRLSGNTTAGSPVPRSIDAQDSISTVYRPDHVIAIGSSIASESFEDSPSEFGQTASTVLADHQELRALDNHDMSDDMYGYDDDDDSMSDATINSFDGESTFEDEAM